MTRRSFLRAGAFTALSAGFALHSAGLVFAQTSSTSKDFAVPQEAKVDAVFYYKKATFDPYVNTTFRARARGADVDLVLVKVTDACAPVRNGLTKKARPTEGFTLLFRASAPLSGITTIHTLEHDALGRFSLFLVRASKEGDRELLYEAVINHA